MNQPQETAFISRSDPGSRERWREDLAHVNRLRQIIHDRPPQPADGLDLLKAELRRALISAALVPSVALGTSETLSPEASKEMSAAVTRGSGAAGAAVITQRCWRQQAGGMVILAEPARLPRAIPTGETGMTQPDWVKGFALAVIARDAEALQALCTPASISSLALPPETIDPFWPFYCGALAAVVVEPQAAPAWIEDAERALSGGKGLIADPGLVEAVVRPVLPLIRALVEKDVAGFNQSLRAALLAHKRYYSQPDLRYDWNGVFSLEGTALAALAFDRGLPLEVASDYLPEALLKGTFSRNLCRVTYQYPLYSIYSADEAHWFLDLEGFPRANRAHQLLERDGLLIAQYDAAGAPGLPRAQAAFVLLGAEPAQEKLPAPLALDPGELVYLAEMYARAAGETGPSVPVPQAKRALLANAAACMEAALRRIPAGQESPGRAQFTSGRGGALYDAEPGRFRRSRLEAYLGALQTELRRADSAASTKTDAAASIKTGTEAAAAAEPAPAGSARTGRPDQPLGGPDGQAGAQEKEPGQAEAAQSAAISIELIRAQVRPILEGLARDISGGLVAQLMPLEDDYGKVFTGEAVELARRAYQQLWAQKPEVQRPAAAGFETRIFVAPAGMLAEENELSFQFPGGYRLVAPWLDVHRVWVAWKYVPYGQTSGLNYDGLVWVDDHWAWFPKPYRALSALAGKS